jgi:beta-glucosidase
MDSGRGSRRVVAIACILAVSTVLIPFSTAVSKQPNMDRPPSPNERAKQLLERMSLREKIEMLHGEFPAPYAFYNEPIERLGIPALTMADGPAGVRVSNPEVNEGKATALPAPIALAAGWDRSLAAEYGDLLGREAFLTGHNVLLAPAVDIARVPVAGRVFEAFGEDPYLQGEIARSVVRGIQSHPVVATVKHYNVYNQETDRFFVSAEVSERALQEIYTPPFEAAVKDGRAGAVMCSYNRVNEVYACENRHLLTTILKNQLGFRGWVMSDFGSTPSTVRAARAGLDQEMPSEVFFGDELVAAVRSGKVSMATIDDKVMRILRQMFRLGLFDRPVQVGPLPEQQHGRRALGIAKKGIVLLKNSGSLLPLKDLSPQSIAIIGADADNASAAGGGSSHVQPTYEVSPLDAIRRRAGAGVRVDHAPGTDPVSAASLLPGPAPVPSSVMAPAGTEGDIQGLRARYWTNTGFQGEPVLDRTEPQAAVNLGLLFALPAFGTSSLPPVPPELIGSPISIRWTGTITAPTTGDYELSLTSLGGSRLYLDGELAIDHWGPHDLATKKVSVQLVGGEPHKIRIDHVADHPSVGGFGLVGATVKFGWRHPANAISPAVQRAAMLAGASDVAVVVVRDYETEQSDRPNLTLPNEQDGLIRAVAAANPRTIVVLNTGAPVAMPWLGRVPAVIEAWYGGQEQGNALAAVLFGDVNPSGKLPITFPRRLSETPTSAPEQFPGVNGSAAYTEGVFVGYRGYDRFGIDPLFPFGHGLSYTSFDYRDLRVASGGKKGVAQVAFTVVNTGAERGSEVAQVYVGELPADVETPPRQLAGFARAALAPGERQRVIVNVRRRSLSYWNSRADKWATPKGRVPVYVGSSSRDIRLEGQITVD